MSVENGYSPGFEQWWRRYPAIRRKGKGAAFKSWQKAKLEDRATELVEILQRQIDNDGQFQKYTPMPATYLNQARFDDYVPKPLPARRAVPLPDEKVETDPYMISVKRVAMNWLARRRSAIPENLVEKSRRFLATDERG